MNTPQIFGSVHGLVESIFNQSGLGGDHAGGSGTPSDFSSQIIYIPPVNNDPMDGVIKVDKSGDLSSINKKEKIDGFIPVRRTISDTAGIAYTLSIAEMIFRISQIYCPVDTGNLLNSGYIKVFDNFVRVGYDTPYAAAVHEIIENKHRAPTRSKFLEEACYDVLAYWQAINNQKFTFMITIDSNGGVYTDINRIDTETFEANEWIQKMIEQVQYDNIMEGIWNGNN